MFIREIHLKNFKANSDTTIKTSRVTILIGQNGSGKSSILQSLLVLKSSLRSSGSDGNPPVTKTKSFDLGDYEDVVTNHLLAQPLSFTLIGEKMLPHGFLDNEQILCKFSYVVQFVNRLVNYLYLGVESDADDFSLSYKYRNGEGKAHAQIGSPQKEIQLVTHDKNGINPRFVASGNNHITNNFNEIFLNSKFTETLLNEFYYVPYNRTATSYGVSLRRGDIEDSYSEPATMISSMISALSKDNKLLDTVSSFIEEISGKTIRTRNLDLPNSSNQGVTIDFTRKETSNAIINEGTGLNQIILLLTVLAKSPEYSIIGIEEPELHLHPSAQSKLAKILIRFAKQYKKQIIFTTHSEHMLYPFLASIANDKEDSLSKNEVSVYYFDLDKNTGFSKAENLGINDHGQLKGGLKGFWDADIETFSEFLSDKND